MKLDMIAKMPVQAQVVLLSGIAFMAFMLVRDRAAAKDLPLVLASIIGLVLGTYNVRCLVTGNCNNWASLVAASYVASMAMTMLANEKVKKA